MEIRDEDILPSPTIGHADKVQQKYVYGIGKIGSSVKLLLDPDKLLNDEDLSLLEQAGGDVSEEGEKIG